MAYVLNVFKCNISCADRLTSSQKTPLTDAGERAMEEDILKESSFSCKRRNRFQFEDNDDDVDALQPSSHSKAKAVRDENSVSVMYCSYCLVFYCFRL